MKEEKQYKFYTFIYSDTTKISIEHCDIYDGKWKYGDQNEVIIKKDYPFYENKCK